MSLARNLIDAALDANLTQNELKAFLVLLRQTLTYRKTSDALRTSKFEKLAHVRKDRLLKAVDGLVEQGLFTTKPHKLHDTEYAIHPDILAVDSEYFFAPAVPKNGKSFCSSGESVSENRVHTYITNTTHKTTTTDEPKNPVVDSNKMLEPEGSSRNNLVLENLPYPESLTDEEKRMAAQCLDGLSPQDASDCLNVLNYNIQHGKVKSTNIALLQALIKQQRQGTLGTFMLKPKSLPASIPSGFTVPSTFPQDQSNSVEFDRIKTRMYQLNSDLIGLETMRRFDTSLEAQYQNKLTELKSLKAQRNIMSNRLTPKAD